VAEVTSVLPRPTRIAVVIVTYNNANVLADCLAALPEGAKGVELTDVVVVDHASTDDSVQIARDFAGLPIQIVRLATNAGYLAGFNAGVEPRNDREPDAVLLISPDCRVRAGKLAEMAEALSVRGQGIVPPRLLNLDGTLQPTLRRAPTIRGAVAEAVVGGKRAGRIGLGELIFDETSHDRARSSAALLIVNKVKLFRSRHGKSASVAYSLAVLQGESLRAVAGRTASRASVAALLRRSRLTISLAELS
jgi:GT2 family glycosyltransferase